MSETPDERRERLVEPIVGEVEAARRSGDMSDRPVTTANRILDALLAELRRGGDGDKAIADMLENGAEQYVAHGGHENVPTGWYRPRADFMRGEHPADPHGTVEP